MTRPLQLPPPLSDVEVTRAARLNVGVTEEGQVYVGLSGGHVETQTAVGFVMAPSMAKQMARQLKRLGTEGTRIRARRPKGGDDEPT